MIISDASWIPLPPQVNMIFPTIFQIDFTEMTQVLSLNPVVNSCLCPVVNAFVKGLQWHAVYSENLMRLLIYFLKSYSLSPSEALVMAPACPWQSLVRVLIGKKTYLMASAGLVEDRGTIKMISS